VDRVIAMRGDIAVLEALQQPVLHQRRKTVAPLRIGKVVMRLLVGGEQEALGLEPHRCRGLGDGKAGLEGRRGVSKRSAAFRS